MNIISGMNKIEKKREKEIKAAIAVLLAFAWIISMLIPPGISFAQSLAPMQVSRISGVERVYDLPITTQPNLETLYPERTPASLSPRSRQESQILKAPQAALKESAAAKRTEGPLAELLSGVRSGNLRVTIPAKPVTYKLAVLADALMDLKIKGYAALNQDKFMDKYVVAVGLELAEWMSDTENQKVFQDIFKKEGPWILVFLAMSPTSMHEYMGDLELPSAAGDITEAHRLPINMTVTQKGKNVIVETQGAFDLWLTFSINEKDEVSIVQD